MVIMEYTETRLWSMEPGKPKTHWYKFTPSHIMAVFGQGLLCGICRNELTLDYNLPIDDFIKSIDDFCEQHKHGNG
jgi:hypothetical protein